MASSCTATMSCCLQKFNTKQVAPASSCGKPLLKWTGHFSTARGLRGPGAAKNRVPRAAVRALQSPTRARTFIASTRRGVGLLLELLVP